MKVSLEHIVDLLLEYSEKMDFTSWEQEIVMTLRDKVDHYSWVGFYWVVKDRLVLGAWDGPEATEHISISIGDGICGRAARIGETVVVDDVNTDGEYLACFPQTKSEIVVPIMGPDGCIGELDIDSDDKAAFTTDDQVQLERLCRAIGKMHPRG